MEVGKYDGGYSGEERRKGRRFGWLEDEDDWNEDGSKWLDQHNNNNNKREKDGLEWKIKNDDGDSDDDGIGMVG